MKEQRLTSFAIAGLICAVGGTADAQARSLDDWTYIQVTANHSTGFGLAAGDINGDSFRDIVSSGHAYHNPGGDMTGSWTQVALPTGMDAILVTDVDGDEMADIIALKPLEQYWLEATDSSGASFDPVQIGSLPISDHGTGTQGYALADLVVGAKPEIVLSERHSASGSIYYFEIPADPASTPWPSVRLADQSNGESVGVGDIDGDGDLDVSGGYRIGGSGEHLAWWENPGDGSEGWAMHTVGETEGYWVERVAIVDINGDSRLDVVVTEENSGDTEDAHTYWFEQPADPRGGVWTRHEVAVQYGTFGMDVGDIDEDGDVDIVTGENITGSNDGSEETIIWENVNGGASFVDHVVDTGKESHHGSRLFDMDGDGDLDIVSIAFQDYELLHLWRNDSTPITPNPDAGTVPDGGSSSDGGVDAATGTDAGVDAPSGTVPPLADDTDSGSACLCGFPGRTRRAPVSVLGLLLRR